MGVTPHLGRLNVMTVRPQGQLHVLVSAYACEPGKGSEPGSAWGWVWSLAQAGINVTVLSRSTGRQAIERALECHHGAGRLCFEYVDVPAAALRTHGIWRVYEHYRLWQKAAYARARCLSEAVDVVHHVSWGAILGGSELWRLGKPFVFGPAGGAAGPLANAPPHESSATWDNRSAGTRDVCPLRPHPPATRRGFIDLPSNKS